MLSKIEIKEKLSRWYKDWNNHDLDGVMEIFHDEIVFVHWTGAKVKGKRALQDAWRPWFRKHRGFRFVEKETFVDESEQKVLFRWTLEWPSLEKAYKGMLEKRSGVDILHFQDGKIIRKMTFSKTSLQINHKQIQLAALSS